MKKIRFILIAVLAVLLMAIPPAWASNTLTSLTGVVASSTVTFNVRGNQGAVQLYLLYDKGNGTSVAISKIEFVVPSLGTTTLYQIPASGTSGTTLSAYTLTQDATGNYIITVAYVPRGATSMKVTIFLLVDRHRPCGPITRSTSIKRGLR
jgi:hypothetical protein